MAELSNLGNSMLEWFSTFWTWLSATQVKDVPGIAGWIPDSIKETPVIAVILGGMLLAYCAWVLVKWVKEMIPLG